jgi:outer membrane protein OmpA-like peptidoglycan-associated protein
MVRKPSSTLAAVIAVLLLAGTAYAQQQEKKLRLKSASIDGTTGLFRTWDAETFRKGELDFSFAWNRYHRDPGHLRFDIIPAAFAVGLADRVEFFGSYEVMRRIRASNIREYRVLPDRPPVPAWSPMGAARFTNEAAFVDVPRSTAMGDLRLGGKFNLLSERHYDPFGLAAVAFVKFPFLDSPTQLNRGLGTGEWESGWGLLFSKRAGNAAVFHVNTMLNWVRDPERQGLELAELQDEFWYRLGAAFPSLFECGRRRGAQFVAELDGKIHFGARTFGANPRDPLDLVLGVKAYPNEWMSIGGAYRASLNKLEDNAALGIDGRGTHGFIAQLTFGRRSNDPPTCSLSATSATIKQDETTTIKASSVDPDCDPLTYSWTASGGKISGTGDTATFDATGLEPGKYTITAGVTDGKHPVNCTTEITVVKKNLPPTVECSPKDTSITMGESATITAKATDPNNDKLSYKWTVDGQGLAADTPTITFGSEGRKPGTYKVTVTVSDGELTATCTTTVTVRERPNRPPTIECLTTSVDVAPGGTVELRVRTSDPDNDKTTVTWSATGGTVSGTGDAATFNATGLRAGIYTVTATVDDGRGGRASCNMSVNVSERTTLPCSFRPGRARLDNKCKAALDDIAVRMQNDTRLRANIIGYTDDSRQDKGLGIKRAQATLAYLKTKQVDASRLTTTDGGTSKPVADNKTAAGRAANRRVEIEFSAK